MKKIIIIFSSFFLLLACEKSANYNATFSAVDSNLTTFVKFINAYPYATPVFSGQTTGSLQLTYNGLQFSGIPIAYGVAFPASANYATVSRENTQSDMYVRLALGTPPAAVRDSFLFAFKPVMQLNKYYSFFFCDSINGSKTILTTEDEVRLPGGPALYRVRFANLIPNPPVGTPAIDVYSTALGTVIFTGIAPKKVTPFIELPRTATSDTYQIRWVGTTTPIATLAVTILPQMSVTLFARGYNTATGTKAPGLSSYRNQ